MKIVYRWVGDLDQNTLRMHYVVHADDLLVEVTAHIDTASSERSWAEVGVLDESGRRPLLRQLGPEFEMLKGDSPEDDTARMLAHMMVGMLKL